MLHFFFFFFKNEAVGKFSFYKNKQMGRSVLWMQELMDLNGKMFFEVGPENKPKLEII